MKIAAAVLTVAVLLTCANDAAAQRRLEFDFGVRAGAPVHMTLESQFFQTPGWVFRESIERPKFTVGPTLGVIVYDRVLVQFDALYKSVRYVTDITAPFGSSINTARGSSWEFPLMLDYRFFSGSMRPYAGGGMVVGQTTSGTTETRSTSASTGTETRFQSQMNPLPEQSPAYVINTGV